MRERQTQTIWTIEKARITPAYAGKTKHSGWLGKNSWDHPRVCGKDAIRFHIRLICWGSPPRMRERRFNATSVFLLLRITPAYAGKTFQWHTWVTVAIRITPAYAGKTILLACKVGAAQDHPRVCGKDFSAMMHLDPSQGSPPRMRERPHGVFSTIRSSRITPAYAGKTMRACRLSRR